MGQVKQTGSEGGVSRSNAGSKVQLCIVPRHSCTRGQGGHGLCLASLHVRPFQRGKTGMVHGQPDLGLGDIGPGQNVLPREPC